MFRRPNAAPESSAAPPADRRALYAAASAGTPAFDPGKLTLTPNFLYGFLAPAWAAGNGAVEITHAMAGELADAIGDDKLMSTKEKEGYHRLTDRRIITADRRRRLHTIISAAINGLPDGSRGGLLDGIVSAHLGRRVALRPTRQLVEDIYQHAYGWGPLDPFLRNEEANSVTEIMVVAHDRIFTERTINNKVAVIQEPVAFESPEVFRQFAEDTLLLGSGRSVSQSEPTVDFSLPDGSRVNVVIPPVSLAHQISIRRFSARTWTLPLLESKGALNAEMRAFLTDANTADANIIAYGKPGSGKTTLLTALIDAKPGDRRLLIVEDTREINVDEARHPNTSRLLTVEARDMRDLVKNALRMRPDHLILGETRDKTAYDLIQAFNTGTTGSLSTLHASGPVGALTRLSNLVMQGESSLSDAAARGMVASAVHLVIHASRMSDGSRRLASIDEVIGLESNSFVVRNIFGLEPRPDGNGGITFDFVRNPDYVMGPELTKMFLDAGLDPERWTGERARAAGLRPEAGEGLRG